MSEQEQPGPPWSEAPEWAGWKAMDGDGLWYWFETEPSWDGNLKFWFADGDDENPEMASDEFAPDCSGIDWDFASSEKYQRPS